MRVSWNWLSEMVDLSALKGGPQELADLLTARGLEVEAMERLDEGFEKVITARILEKKKHPEADRLSLCRVEAGSGEPTEIVCGAQNMKEGDMVALAQPGARLPNGLKIKPSKIRGVKSHGMLCSEEELKLAEQSEGILILPEGTEPGRPVAEVLGRKDTVIELSVTPNRADCLSHWGVAREVAAATGCEVRLPETPSLPLSGDCPVKTALEAGGEAPQFWGCLIEGVKVGPSPEWLVRRLQAVGARSINNVVDVTNYVLFELGHPMHAYDADLLEGDVLSVRRSQKGEKVELLDGDEVELTGEELVIADTKKPVALAGVMGGGNSEVRDGSTRLYLECAEFDPVLVRRAARRNQKHSEAAHRFERGVDPNALRLALSRMAGLITEVAGGKIVSATVSATPERGPEGEAPLTSVPLDPAWLIGFLGMDLRESDVEKALVSLGCRVDKGSPWKVTVPSHRRDLSIREDLAEEVARSVGYDRIPATVPALTGMPSPVLGDKQALELELSERAKDSMVRQGFLEALNYSFTSRAWLGRCGMEGTVPVENPLSEEHEMMVPALLPSLIRNALDNWHHHFGSEPLTLRLFELRPTFHRGGSEVRSDGNADTGIREEWKLSFVMSGPRFEQGLRAEKGELDFYDLKAVAEGLFEDLGTRGIRFRALDTGAEGVGSLFHPGQSVEILAGKGSAGYLGRLHPRLAKRLKCRAPLWVAELDWNSISSLSRTLLQPKGFVQWSEFPGIERDFALLVKEEVEAERIVQVALKSGKPLAKSAKVFDIYKGSQVDKGMTSVAVRVIFSEEGRSLQEAEADEASSRILARWEKELGARLRG